MESKSLTVKQFEEFLQNADVIDSFTKDFLILRTTFYDNQIYFVEIATQLGVSWQKINSTNVKLGKKISNIYGIEHFRDNGKKRYWDFLASYEKCEKTGNSKWFRFVMRHELQKALRNLGWVQELLAYESVAGEIITEKQQLREGSLKKVVVNAYERNPLARKQCLAHHGYTCVICGFDFASIYGKLGEGYIQVHHKVPLSQIKCSYVIDPIKDLIPVCANCHAMIHRDANKTLSIEEVKEHFTTPK